MGISIHKQNLYDIENNKKTVKDYKLLGIAYVLGMDLNDLLKAISFYTRDEVKILLNEVKCY